MKRDAVRHLLERFVRDPGDVELALDLAGLSFGEVLELDERLRGHGFIVRPTTALVRPDAVGGRPKTSWWRFACAACFADGYVRERAVERLAASDSPAVLPFLIVRTNDWVPVIAAKALAAVFARLTPEHADGWIDAFPFLRQPRRGESPTLYNAAAALVQSPDPRVRHALRDALFGPNRRVRRALLPLLRELEGDDVDAFLRRAGRSSDPRVATESARLRIERAPSSGVTRETRAALMTELAQSPHASVRLAALKAAVALAANPEDLQRALRPALLDAAAAVREHARFFVAKNGVALDPLAIARDALSTSQGRALGTAIGIARESGETRADLFRAFTASSSVDVRNAAYLALAKLGQSFDEDELLLLIAGPSHRLAKTAAKLFDRSIFDDTKRKLLALQTTGAHPHTRILAASLLQSIPAPRFRA